MPARKKTTTDGEPAAPAPKKRAPAAKKPAAPRAPRAKSTAVRKGTAAPARRIGGAGGKDLVIVESPAKANTINKYLGSNFIVLASYGHVRDLPRGRKVKGETVSGINIEEGWVPRYEVPKPEGKGRRKTAQDVVNELKKAASTANNIYLATDPDREGEAIAWHILDELKLSDEHTFRITFNEITKTAVQAALAHPEKVDMDRVRAQEARRILDRVVGYPLSNFLGDKLTRGLTAGRVQSVALRLVVDREREIEAFKTEEFWKVIAELAPTGSTQHAPTPFQVVMAKKKGEKKDDAKADDGEPKPEKAEPARDGAFKAELATWNGEKFAASTVERAREIADVLDTAAYTITGIEQKDRADRAPPPFTTSTLQQQASLRLGFAGQRTMGAAQKLYEGVPLGGEQVALITYMRTDSTRLSNDALGAVRDHIKNSYGERYLPAKPNFYASGKGAQEAHEAIRPTDFSYTPQRVQSLGLQGDQLRLYTLIYNRTVACQMTPAIFAVTNVEVTATGQGRDGVGVLKAQGRILKFDGYRKVMTGAKAEDAELPQLAERQRLDRLGLLASQHFTQPPPRFNEASLIKALEKEGIGRPSTYAAIIGKITSDDRGYIEVKDRRFFATEIGKVATDILVENFPKVMDLKFTSQMEEELDQIATRQTQYETVLNDFWQPFNDALTTARTKLGSVQGQETGEPCPQCGRPLVKMFSKKTGNSFIGCSGYREDPPCKYIKPREGEEARPAAKEAGIACPNCGKPMMEKFSRRGPFLGCSGYPDCKTTMNIGDDGTPKVTAKPTDHKCDKCGSPMVIREGRRGPFLACTGYPKCKNAQDVDANGNPVRPIETGVTCDKCNSPMTVKKGPRGPFLSCSGYPKCRNAKPIPPELADKVAALMPAPAKKEGPQVEVTQTCPQCGAAMKLRQGRNGYFLGCSKYPKCKGVAEPSVELLEQISAKA